MQAVLDVPDPVRDVLTSIVDAAKQAFGDDLRSVILYGSAAEGRLRATSDVNLVFVLSRFEAAKAAAFREPFRFARAAADLSAMFILASELEEAALEFAQKFADMKRRHVVLYGDDPLATITIPREALVRRLNQILLNLTLRLRDLYIERSLRDEQSAITLADTAGPLRAAAASMLELEGRGTLPPKEALEALAGELGDPRFVELLPHLSEARETRALPAGRASELLFAAIELARALHERAHAL